MATSLHFQAISDAEVGVWLDKPFNPPVLSETFTEDNFRSEYWAAHDAVTDALEILGTQNAYGEGDFCANDSWGYSRFIGIEFSTNLLWRPELIPLIQSALLKQPQPFVVYLEHELLDEPKFYLFVQPTKVTGYIPSAMHRQAFGL